MCLLFALLLQVLQTYTDDTRYEIRTAGKITESSNSVGYLHELFPVRQQYRFVRQNKFGVTNVEFTKPSLRGGSKIR